MISMARTFGAPVIEPPGKVARRSRARPTTGRAELPMTVDTR